MTTIGSTSSPKTRPRSAPSPIVSKNAPDTVAPLTGSTPSSLRVGEARAAGHGDRREHARRRGELLELDRRVIHDARPGRKVLLALDHDQPIGIAIRQRPQQHAVDDAEDRRRGADAERERQRARDGEALAAQQAARGNAKSASTSMAAVLGPVANPAICPASRHSG